MLNANATRIQAAWRGYQVRRCTAPQLSAIRNQLNLLSESINNNSTLLLDPNSSTVVFRNTLGERIHNSLETLDSVNVSIQQIVLALSDLDTVTRLSPECCRRFVKERAVEHLYTFISNCNRSVPHQDLIKLCLRVLLNLAKYAETCAHVIDLRASNAKLGVLLTLLQSYQASSPAIFVTVCVIIGLVGANSPEAKHSLQIQEFFVKKLSTLRGLFDRRVHLNKRQGVGVRRNAVFSFNLLPDWTLAAQQVDLIDPLHAIEHLYRVLEISNQQRGVEKQHEANKNAFIAADRPVKSFSGGCIAKNAAPKSAPKKTTTSISGKKVALVKNETIARAKVEKDLHDEEKAECSVTSDVEVSYQSVDSTIKSVSGFYANKPSMNSTILVKKQPSFRN